jgi:beta-lactamase class D
MKKWLLALMMMLVSVCPALAETHCFIMKERGKTIVQEGECAARHSPCSTFKIPLALMGFDSGILKDAQNPVWNFKNEYVLFLANVFDNWKQPYNPTLWIKNSSVWFSQVLTRKLGWPTFADYVKTLHYGNQDISGDKGKNNGLTNAWLSSSLQISPEEQIVFLQELIDERLPVSLNAQEITKQILKTDTVIRGWTVYGKTGSGNILSSNGSREKNFQIGWYVGWIQKDMRAIPFAYFIQDSEYHNVMAGKRAKKTVQEKLEQVIQSMR